MLLRERSNKSILSATLLGGKVIKMLSTTWLGEDGRFGGCFMTDVVGRVALGKRDETRFSVCLHGRSFGGVLLFEFLL
jgi:hypothetical protein